MEDVKLLIEEAQAKLSISKEATSRYGSQAGMTLYETLMELDISPVVIFGGDRITLSYNGVSFPIWLSRVRTINPKALRFRDNCPEIREILTSASYCFNHRPGPFEEAVDRREEIDNTRESAIKIMRILSDLESGT